MKELIDVIADSSKPSIYFDLVTEIGDKGGDLVFNYIEKKIGDQLDSSAQGIAFPAMV